MNELSVISSIQETDIGVLFTAVLFLLISALLCGKAATRIGLPKVAGEILGGMLVGPTVLGRLSAPIYNGVFFGFPEEGSALSVIYWLGMVFLMFSSGCDSDMRDLGRDRKIIIWLIAGSTILPLFAGYYISGRYFAADYLGAAGNVRAFNIVFAIAAAITSVPVISKIFMDLGLIGHRFARIILATATIQDLLLWVLLAVATGMVTHSQVGILYLAGHVVVTVSFFAFAVLISALIKKTKLFSQISDGPLLFVLCFSFICAGAVLDVSVMYCAFIAGIVFGSVQQDDSNVMYQKLRDVCMSFFTPLYFAIVGLRIYVTDDFNLPRFLAFLSVVSILELIGCVIAMKLIRLDWLSSFNLGIAMNARGGPGIVLATVTYDLRIINYEFFCTLIFTVLISSTFAGWWIKSMHGKDKLLVV